MSNLITIIMQYFATRSWGSLEGVFASIPALFGRGGGAKKDSGKRDKKLKQRIAEAEQKESSSEGQEADIVVDENGEEIEPGDETVAEKRSGSGAGYTTTPRRVKHRPRSSRSRRPKRK
jgi:hypothetical protein